MTGIAGRRVALLLSAVAVAVAHLGARDGVAGEIRLMPEFHVRGAIITLGDMAVISGADPTEVAALERLELFAAPAESRGRAVSREKIRELLILYDVDFSRFKLTGADSVKIAIAESRDTARSVKTTRDARPVKAASAQQSSEEIVRAIAEYLGREAGNETPWYVQPELSTSAQQRIPARYDSVSVTGGQAPWVGVQHFTLTFQVRQAVHQMDFPARVTRPNMVVVALRPLAQGEVLRASDVFLQAAEGGSAGGMTHVGDVVGREVTRNISSGQTIEARSLRRPLIVKRRQLVTVYSRVGQVEVKTSAMAVQDGSLGDMVEVESMDRKARYSAVVAGPNVVHVYAGGATVSPDIRIEHR